MIELSEDFWNQKYKAKKTGWDLGEISQPLKAYFDQLTDTSLRILIPGGGNSYEAEYLHNKGFPNVYVIDIAKEAIERIRNRVPSFPEKHLIHDDFFNLEGHFDIVIEQTFFCALHPNLRADYVSKMKRLLSKKGQLVGVLFEAPLNANHPPFGGSKKEYLQLFESHFNKCLMEECYNSSAGRQGMELFVNMSA